MLSWLAREVPYLCPLGVADPYADSSLTRAHCWISFLALGIWWPTPSSPLQAFLIVASPTKSTCNQDQGTCPYVLSGRGFLQYLPHSVQGQSDQAQQPFVFLFPRKELGTISWALQSPENIG